jgi:hypothetical protein
VTPHAELRAALEAPPSARVPGERTSRAKLAEEVNAELWRTTGREGQVKTWPAQIKAAGTHDGTEEGRFESIVATYDVDSVGDRRRALRS